MGGDDPEQLVQTENTGGAHSTDVRMTTRFKPDNVMEGLTGAIHETGGCVP